MGFPKSVNFFLLSFSLFHKRQFLFIPFNTMFEIYILKSRLKGVSLY